MGHWVTTETSDYWAGWCDIPGCTERPCLSCVAAQERIEARDRFRGQLVSAYYEHHKQWPQGRYIDALMEIFQTEAPNMTAWAPDPKNT